MENTYSHNGFIHYNMDISRQALGINVALTITSQTRVQKYKDYFIDDSLPSKLSNSQRAVDNLFVLLQRKENFMIDPVKGQIIVLLRNMEIIDEEVSIKLSFLGEEDNEEMESNIEEEFGGQISQLVFPEFGGEGREVKGFERQMIIFHAEMQEWKKEFEDKKEQIRMMKRVKWSKNDQYQGQMKNRKRDGFGIMFGINHEFTGDRFEGEFKNDKFNGKGIYYYHNGKRYEGNYKDNKRNGIGIYYWPDGSWEQGECKNGKRHGKAMYHYPNGKVEERIYWDGQILK